MRIRTYDELIAGDERSLRFTPLGLSLSGMLPLESAAEYQQQLIAKCDLSPDVPETTRLAFGRIRTLHAYGVFFYDAYTIADDLSSLTLEFALRERFLAWHQEHPVALRHKNSGKILPLEATSWHHVDHSLRSGAHRKGPWVLETPQGDLDFTGNVKTLLGWARGVGLLPGHRSRGIDPLLHAARNNAGHMSYHLLGPVHSGRAIRDLAEVINQLWGHATPGGRLFPAPLELEPMIITWSADEHPIVTVATREQFKAWNPLPEQECIVVAAVSDDNRLPSYDNWYERTDYPSFLLWGPGTLTKARTWLEGRPLDIRPTPRLDRLFAVRYDESRVDLPMRPAVAASLAETDADGRWVLVRADHPDDAFAHGMHRRAGLRCVRLNEPAVDDVVPCATEQIYEGDHQGLLAMLSQEGLASELELVDDEHPARVRIPGLWR